MDQHSTPQSKTLAAPAVLEFRVSRPGIPIRRLRLTGNRYTFGRDPAATVRLDDPSLQPVHALMLREIVGESERLILQAMSFPLQINGRLTTEATLHTGDKFALGEFQFEFIGSVDPPKTSTLGSRRDANAPPEIGGERASEEAPAVRTDSKAKPSSPRLSFAAGMRLVNETEEAASAGFPLRPERTLDAIEQALSSETDQTEMGQCATRLRQEIERTLREESQRALDQQKNELSQEHRREMEKVLQRFAETQEQAAAANRAIESMRQQVADLGRQLRNATEIKREHQEAFDRTGKERDAAREELRQASATSQRLISELDAARRDRSEISSSLHDMTIQLYTATAEGDKAQSRARELVRQREEAFQKVESFALRCEELSEQLRQAEQTCQTVSDQRDQFSEQLRQRTAERDSAVALADQRSDELIAKESVIDTLRSQVTELEQAVAESRREAETLRTECQAACESVAKLEEVVRQGEQQRQADRASWEAESAELRASVEQISIELAAASNELTQSNETADALNAELTETRNALAEAESEVALRPSVDELQAIRERLEATEQQLRQLQIESENIDGAAVAYAEDPVQPYAEDPAQPYAEDPAQPYAEDPAQSYAEDPAQPYVEEPVQGDAADSAESASNPTPWAIDLNNPWNLDSSDLATPDQQDPWNTAPVPADHDESVDDGQMATVDDAAENASLPWQPIEECDTTTGEEPTAGSFASELLKQLGEPEESPDTAAVTDSLVAGEEASVEPAMQENEIEQVREFLQSDDASAEHETFCDDNEKSESDFGYGEPVAFASPDAESGDDQASDGPHREETNIGSAACPATAAESDEDEDSIEAYMNRLLQRVQGGSSASYSSKPATAPGCDEVKSTPAETQQAAAPSPAEPEAPIDDDAPFVPRSQAPERSKNLAAMRELANSSARTAIMSSVRKQAHSTAIQKFAQAAGCAVGACVMLYYSQLKVGWQILAAICMISLAAYWIIEAIQLRTQLQTETNRDSAPANPVTDPNPVTDAAQENSDAEPEEAVDESAF